jgi:uncharacterized membrane protein HdeD (DUF308 family)
MLTTLTDGWWTFALRGVVALLFGLGALSYPGLTLLVLIVFFGAYALIDGATALIMGIGERKSYTFLLIGLISVAAGIVALVRPGATALALLFVIGVWAVVHGVTEIVAAMQIRKEVEGEWAIALSGVVSVLFGLFVLARPGAGALALVWLIASYAFVFGILQLMLGFKLRRLKKEMAAASAPVM